MNESFLAYVSGAKSMAEEAGWLWPLPVAQDGAIDMDNAWNLTELCGSKSRPFYRMNDLGFDTEMLASINARRMELGQTVIPRSALSSHWQAVVKAAVVRQALINRNTPAHIASQVARPIRVLATSVAVTSGAEPWQLTARDIQTAVELAGKVQKSGALGLQVRGVVKTVFDNGLLCDNGLFIDHPAHREMSAPLKRGNQILARLKDRASPEKLPDAAAVWELVDIVFTKKPKWYADMLRFSQMKIQFVCGFRVNEVCTIPQDWKRVREFVALDGTPAGELGGISTSLMLRHFAEKQRGANENSVELVEAFQHVPKDFEFIVEGTLEQVAKLTAPLRARLEQQTLSGRHFPEFELSDLIPLSDAYTRLLGDPVIMSEAPTDHLMDAYRSTFSDEAMEKIRRHQAALLADGHPFSYAFVLHWSKWPHRVGSPPFRLADGSVQEPGHLRLRDMFLRVDELEEYVIRHLPTKTSDIHPLPLEGGKFLAAHECLFLKPKRMLAESRNGRLCDLSRYFSVGLVLPSDIIKQLSGRPDGIFQRYSETEAGRGCSLVTHSIRHMQNTALFQMGISDAAITKRFDRKTVAQSYVYDHRTLAEKLEAIDLPASARQLPDKPKTVLKMIMAGTAKGSITTEFKRIQKQQGDEKAFEFLAAEADGFHATPYGHCINGFTQEPCPKLLQCTSGCSHFVNSGLDKNRSNIELLLAKTERAVEEISKRSGGAGWANQMASARNHVANLRKVLATAEGERPFPDGPDLSQPLTAKTVFDV